MFIRFRELMSARGNALLQLFLPVDHDDEIWSGRPRLHSEEQEALAVAGHVVTAGVPPDDIPTNIEEGHARTEPELRARLDGNRGQHPVDSIGPIVLPSVR